MEADHISDNLRNLGLKIIPCDGYLRKADRTANKIAKLLGEKSRYAIGKMCIAGSDDKKTTIIIGSDIDIIVFINDEDPPFEDVIDDFKNVLTNARNIRCVRTTKYSVQFKFGNFDFDLLPAKNFLPNDQNYDSDERIDFQRKRALDRIKRDPERLGYIYSGSFAEANVRFMKRQTMFVNEMVRIAKFWFQSLYFGKKILSAKLLIELVAVFVANEAMNKYNERSHLRCFVDIIQMLQGFESLNVVFEDEYEKIPGHQVLDVSRPRVLDPSNPYNNLAKNWSENSKQMIKKYADETYRRLEVASTSAVSLHMVFEPQPIFLAFMADVFNQVRWIITFVKNNISVTQADLIIKNDAILKDRNKCFCIDTFRMYLFNTWSIFATEDEGGSLEEVFEKSLNKHVLNSDEEWIITDGDYAYEDYDGTFTFLANDTESILIGFLFNN